MKNIIKLSIEINVELTSQDVAEFQKDPKAFIKKQCFVDRTRGVYDVKLDSIELIDDTISAADYIKDRSNGDVQEMAESVSVDSPIFGML